MNDFFSTGSVKILRVSELTQQIKALLEDGFPSIWVSGEVSNVGRPTSGHVYLSLKDGTAALRAVIWRSLALRQRFELRDGLEVIARGRISLYPPKGEYQLVVEEIEPKGVGALELALRQLKGKLLDAGYFAPERKKPLPRFPKRVALVTSPSGAAVRDMLEIITRRWPSLEVWVCAVRVQGAGAGQEIAAAVDRLNRVGGVDVLIVGRGGGSTEDLWAFNEECVAHALFRSRIPVVSAVGHEVDLTIADLVADRRALTPSEAAELVTPNRTEIRDLLRGHSAKLENALWQGLEMGRRRVQDLVERAAFRRPLERIHDHERRLDDFAERLLRSTRQRLTRANELLSAQSARLESLSPLNVLSRGYSLTRREADQVVLRSADQVRAGDRIVTRLDRGTVFSRVESVSADPSSA